MNKADFYSNTRSDIPGPLAGIRVLEATTTWAGPMCAAELADFGADVIKVEIPSGDVSRAVQPNLPGTGVTCMHATVNRNKCALSVGVRTEQGRDIFLKLAVSADVIVENFKVGTMSSYGLGYKHLCAVKPDIVYVSITGWGQFGPNHEAAVYDPLAQASYGCMSVNGAAVPSNVYECQDGSVFAGVLPDAHWRTLAPIIGEPDLADHESFATRNERVANRELCNFLLGTWLASRTRAEAIATFREVGLPRAPVNTYREAAQDSHVLERDMLQETLMPSGATAPIVGPAVKFSRTPTRVRHRAPEIGEHNAEILASIGINEKDQEHYRRLA